MKVLSANIFFDLGDDFEGDLPDALIELANYLKTKGKSSFGRGLSTSNKWEDYLVAIDEGYRVTGNYGINEWIGDTWEPLD